MPEKTYTLGELADVAGVSGRTIRYYIAQGVLQNPVQLGCNAHYTEEHLERLRFIKAYQERGYTLAGIKAQLGGGQPGAIFELLAGNITIHPDGSETRPVIPTWSWLQIPILDGVVLNVRMDYFQRYRIRIVEALQDLVKTLGREETNK